jgi:uncharacterized protein DUF4232
VLVLLMLLLLLFGDQARAPAPPCRAGQLHAARGRTAVGVGNLLEEVVFTNVSRRACVLRGYPTIASDGQNVHAMRGGTYFGRLVPVVLRPGTHGFLDFGTADHMECGVGPRTVEYPNLVFALPGGGRLQSTVSITEHCSLSISELGRPEPPR